MRERSRQPLAGGFDAGQVGGEGWGIVGGDEGFHVVEGLAERLKARADGGAVGEKDLAPDVGIGGGDTRGVLEAAGGDLQGVRLELTTASTSAQAATCGR